MKQLTISVEEERLALLTQFLDALHISYQSETSEAEVQDELARQLERRRNILSQTPKHTLGGKFDTLHIRSYANEE